MSAGIDEWPLKPRGQRPLEWAMCQDIKPITQRRLGATERARSVKDEVLAMLSKGFSQNQTAALLQVDGRAVSLVAKGAV